MTSIPCLTDPELLALAAGDAAPEGILRHVSGCVTCGPKLERLRAEVAAVRRAAIRRAAIDHLASRNKEGKRLGPFRLDTFLGEGTMGEVYKATHEPDRQTVAVKVIRAEIASRPEIIERIKEEGKILGKLSHSNIVSWRKFGEYEGTWCLAMEFLQGQTLDQRLIAQKKLPWQEVVDLGIQICAGLQHAHWQGIIHRDLKPSNIMITDAGVLKLTDFGIAKDRGTLVSISVPGSIVGTAAYMAPERWKSGGVITYKADLYSLGVVFYQMLTGGLPFQADTLLAMMNAHRKAPRPHPGDKLRHIPRVLDQLVVQLMSRNPDNRPRDAEQVGAVLTGIRRELDEGRTVENFWSIDGPGLHPRIIPEPEPPKPAPPPPGPPAKVLVMILLLVGAIIVYAFIPRSQTALFERARQAMASDDRHVRKEVLEIVSELNRRYPANPHKAQTQGWYDQITLEETGHRADALDSPFGHPRDSCEESYKEYSSRASALINQWDWEGAASVWDDLAKAMNPDEPREKPWHMVAKQRHMVAKQKAAGLREQTERRRKEVSAGLDEIRAHTDAGRVEMAKALRADLYRRYGPYQDVADLLAPNPPQPQPDPLKVKAPATPATGTNGSAPSTPDR
jgi:serine/threonine protein kinase